MFYSKIKNEIIKRCLFVDFDDQSLGGESFETIVDRASNKCNLDSKWCKYSKNPSGYDQCIKNEEMSIKTVINRNKKKITLTSYRLTKCKYFQEFYDEIDRRDQKYKKVFLLERNCNSIQCEFIFYEIPVEFFKISKEYTKNKKSISTMLKNKCGNVLISFSASNQLSFSIEKKNIEEYKQYSFILSTSMISEHRNQMEKILTDYTSNNLNIKPNYININMNKLKIISLFDGISCAQLAINSLGVKQYEYYSSEIDKYAQQITKLNYPKTKFIGDVCNFDHNNIEYKYPYLLIGGSPCQNLSSRGNKKGLDGEKSSLFFEYVKVLKSTKPTYFLLENVGSMSSKNRDIITDELKKVFDGSFEYIKINSRIFIPQNRRRYYWTNIPFLEENLPTPTKVKVQDLLEPRVDDIYYYSEHNKKRSFVVNSFNSKPESDLEIARTIKTQSYTGRAAVDNCYHTKYKPKNRTNLRRLTPKEFERLQGIPDDYTKSISDTQRYKCIGNSFTVPVISWFLKYIFELEVPHDNELQVPPNNELDYLKSLKVLELKQLCREKKLKRWSKLKKAELIKLLCLKTT